MKPAPPMPQAGEPVSLGVMSAFLHSGRSIDHASSLFLLAACVLAGGIGDRHGLWLPLPVLLLSLLLATLEKYLAWRVALDARLFAVLEQTSQQELAHFDAALAAFLGQSGTGQHIPTRSMDSRWQGARRLFLQQALCCGVQVALLLGAALWRTLPGLIA